jgi:sugar-specific transcriptional regulator TrmB
VFKQNRALGKKVVPLKEYFDQTAKEFAQKEAEKKEEATQKKREYAKLTPCERKMNTLQRNIDGYIKSCDREFSNEALIEMMDKARARASAAKPKAAKATKAARKSRNSSTSKTFNGGRRTRRKLRK